MKRNLLVVAGIFVLLMALLVGCTDKDLASRLLTIEQYLWPEKYGLTVATTCIRDPHNHGFNADCESVVMNGHDITMYSDAEVTESIVLSGNDGDITFSGDLVMASGGTISQGGTGAITITGDLNVVQDIYTENDLYVDDWAYFGEWVDFQDQGVITVTEWLTPTGTYTRIAAADWATPTVTSGCVPGTLWILENWGSENICIADGSGFYLAGDTDWTAGQHDSLMLLCDAGGNWIELSRSDN